MGHPRRFRFDHMRNGLCHWPPMTKAPLRPETNFYRITAVDANFLTMASSNLRSLSLRLVE